MSANTPKWAKKALDRHPAEWWTTPLGYRQDGRPIFPIAGGDGSDDDDADDTDDQDGDEDDTDDDDDTDDGGADDDGDGSGDDDLSDAEKKLEARLAKRLDAALGKATERIADRLVNAEETRRRKAARRKQQQGGSGSGGDGGSGGGNRPTASALRDQQAQLDAREARTAYREYVADGFSFETSAEREAGQAIARAVIDKEIGEGADPDDAGKMAADQVKKLLKDVRAGAEKAVRARLIKAGELTPGDKDKTGTGPGKQAAKGPKSPGDSSQLAKGAAKARELLPGRFPQNQQTST